MKKHSVLINAAEACIVFLLAFLISFYDVFYSFDSLMRDKLYQQPRGINNKIKIIAIDDETLRELGPFGTWSRSVYADVIERLGDMPAVIGMDIMVFGENDSEGDETLKKACTESGRVVSGSYINYTTAYCVDENGKPYIDHLNIADIEEPIIYGYAQTGFVNAVPDDDGIVRSAMLSASYDGRTYSSFAAKIYSVYCEKMGVTENTPRLDENGRMWINYAGRPGDYEYIPLSAVLNGSVDTNVFKDCIVLIGAYASGLQDQFSVPNSADQMYGVEIHANIIQGLLDGKSSVPAPRAAAALLTAAVSCIAYILTKKLALKFSTPLTVVLIAGSIAAFIALNSSGISFPLVYLALCVLVCYLINLIRKYVEENIEKKKITDAFKKYVAPQVVEEIAKKGGYHIRLGGENRNIAVLFVDIRGFTPMSESL
ncbi:MAG: CHASE2 domain-containing protein, partial [Oscillospiraceae bacterium]